MKQNSARALVLAALSEWRQQKRFADSILQELLARSRLSASDRAFATELFYGILRNLTLLDFWIGQLRSAAIDAAARDLLRLGLYQIFLLRTPGHAAVFETVALASSHRRSLVNAILRAALRQSTELQAAADTAPLAVRKSHPQFLIERWIRNFGDSAATELCQGNNEPAPIYARINRLKITAEEFLDRYPTSRPVGEIEHFVRLTEIPLDALVRGECYIQDPGTRIACKLLAPQPGEDVLDACAAPGGKTSFLAELMQNRGRLIAADRDITRVQILRENLERLGAFLAKPIQHDWRLDAAPNDTMSAGFDRILVDAPCTNTGVMRRRVDLRWRLSEQDFVRLPNEQFEILRAIIPRLKEGGTLVYSTCSIEPEENEAVVERLLREFPFLQLAEQQTSLPFRDGYDGAFAAKLLRIS